MLKFPTRFSEIAARIDQLDVREYGKTRNYLQGGVSYLSPYISRGIITIPFVLSRILKKNSFQEAERFIYELAWREFFQRTWHAKGWDILNDQFHPQQVVVHTQHLKSILNATSGIEAVDNQITQLYDTGYMHNHARMYVASITCNIGKAHWKVPANWMYYHLLDGDLASNSLSWQWVAGTFSQKKYYCNQSNINHFANTNQLGTFLDCSYEEVEKLSVPKELQEIVLPTLETTLPDVRECTFNFDLPLLLYNSYNLDPVWRSNQDANRLLILEPSHFKKLPVSKRVLDFILELSSNISQLQIFVGEVNEIPGLENFPAIYSKAHPAFEHYPGIKDAPEWMFPNAVLKNSFSAFWKSCQKQ